MTLPPADPVLVAETVAALPSRLQKRLDATISGSSGWVVADGVVDLGSAKVTLRPERGVLRLAENVTCDCLLAPSCLHRAAVLSVAPVADDVLEELGLRLGSESSREGLSSESPMGDDEGGRGGRVGGLAGGRESGGPMGESAIGDDGAQVADNEMGASGREIGLTDGGQSKPQTGDGGGQLADGEIGSRSDRGLERPSRDMAAPAGFGGVEESEGWKSEKAGQVAERWKPSERAAARMIEGAAGQVLEAGLAGAGAALQGQLLAGVHQARLRSLHRLAAATTRVVSGIRAARSDDASFSLPTLSADLLEVLSVAHAVGGDTGDPGEWRGTARTVYAPVGGLRLAGLGMEAVMSSAGYAGVVVWLTDAEGRLWSVSDVKPGGGERVVSSASGPVVVGETGLSHRELARAGLIMASATANPDGRLGAGSGVRAVRAAGVAWTEPQLLRRFGGLNNRTAGPNGAGSPQLLSLTVCGSERDALLAVDDAGEGVRLVAPAGDQRQIHRDNLRLLADRPGLRMLAMARSRPDDGSVAPAGFLGLPGTLELIAVGGGDLRLPAALNGHADLGFDRLSPRFLRPSGPPPPFPQTEYVSDPLLAYRRRLDRVVSGGRRTLSVPGVSQEVRSEATRLRGEQLATAATLLEGLLDAAQPAERDAFGRRAGADGGELSRAWLAAGIYQRALLAAPF